MLRVILLLHLLCAETVITLTGGEGKVVGGGGDGLVVGGGGGDGLGDGGGGVVVGGGGEPTGGGGGGGGFGGGGATLGIGQTAAAHTANIGGHTTQQQEAQCTHTCKNDLLCCSGSFIMAAELLNLVYH